MIEEQVGLTEETLDPENWDALRTLGHRMVDDILASLRTQREAPPWRRPSEAARKALGEPPPENGQDAAQVYEEFKRNVLPYATGNIHPRFWGWVMGTGTPFTVLAEMLAAGMNPNVGGFDDGASLVEDRVLDWWREIMGFPEGASGILVSGGSMANLVGLTVARSAKAGFDVRRLGVAASAGRLTAYASRETHNSVQRALEILGLGSESLRVIPTDGDYRVDISALTKAIADDRAAGCRPFCVVGNAGTVNTGAFDDLDALADLAEREGLWFHVDGAFGALLSIAPKLRHLLRGLDRADSLAFDLHKWGYFPIEVGVALVKRGDDHRAAFKTAADYLAVSEGGLAARSSRFNAYGIQLSRSFRALKVWMGMKEQGTLKLGRLIQQNVDQAAYLAERVRETPGLELLAPVPLNIVCFRYVAPGRSDGDLNALNQRILVRLQEDGIAIPSYTTLAGRYAIRVAITNHRSRREDFDLLTAAVVRLGRELA